jgi:hypothetical protein
MLKRRWEVLLFFFALVGSLGAAEPISFNHQGWKITADVEKGVMIIAHEKLGIVLQDVKLNLLGKNGTSVLAPWRVQNESSDRLTLHTLQPQSSWSLETAPDYLKILCTSSHAMLTARAPASEGRMVARLLDPQGIPVDWKLTDEAKGRWGSAEPSVPSYLPARQAGTMYFSFGKVSGNNFHALFDRKTDTAIRFTDQTRMGRDRQEQDFLALTIPVPGISVIQLIPDYYTKTLGVPYYIPYDDSIFSKAPAVWCSWTAYYDEATEADIVRNTDWLAAQLKPYGFEYVQVDDGYDRGKKGEHDWIENWDPKIFPHGPQWIAHYIKSKGLRPGLWLVPNAYAGATKQHPEWYLYDKKGNFIWDYSTPSLDSTHPEVLAFLKKMFGTLKEWGFEYYKFDGENALPLYVPELDLNRLFDQTIDPLVAYRKRLQVIREAIGPETFVEGCPAGMPLNGIGYFNSYFTGHDVFNSWPGMYPFFSSITANAFLNHLVVYVMPAEGIDVGLPMTVEEARKKRSPHVVATAQSREDPLAGFGTTLAEARTLTTYASLTGVVYSLASVTPELPEERSRLLKMTLPTMPILPMDLFSRGSDMRWDRFKKTTPDAYTHNYPEILDLKVNSRAGIYDVVGLTNWRGTTARKEISLATDLGLDNESRYVVFDFWNQKLLGVFQDRLEVSVEPHDTRVLMVHPFLNHPQLVGNSRHISGSYSILDLGWDGSKKKLKGSSETVPGDSYSLTFYVPEGSMLPSARAFLKDGKTIPASQTQAGNSCIVQFQGQPETVNWEVEFGAKTAQ